MKCDDSSYIVVYNPSRFKRPLVGKIILLLPFSCTYISMASILQTSILTRNKNFNIVFKLRVEMGLCKVK